MLECWTATPPANCIILARGSGFVTLGPQYPLRRLPVRTALSGKAQSSLAVFVLILRARNEPRIIKRKTQRLFSAERKRDQGARGRGRINGGIARREDPVYVGFDLELAGVERATATRLLGTTYK